MLELDQTLGRYTLPLQRDDDWGELLADWEELVPIGCSLWLLSKFGELFICQSDQQIGMLQVSAFKYCVVAKDKTAFNEGLSDPDRKSEWLLTPLVDQLEIAGRQIEKGQCYSFIRPLALGGSLSVENVMTIPIFEHFRCWGEVFRQLKDVPDGSKVILTTKREKTHPGGMGT